MKNHFSPRQALPTTFFLYTLITLVILNTVFGLVWTTPWSAEKEFFFKIFKNSQFAKFAKFRMQTQLFPKHDLPIFLALHPHYTGDTPYRVWFDLGNSLTRWKRIIFKILKNSPFAKFAKFRMKTQLFPRHALPNSFLLYTAITLVILHTEFGLIWTTPWPDEKQLFLKF